MRSEDSFQKSALTVHLGGTGRVYFVDTAAAQLPQDELVRPIGLFI